MVPSSSGSAGRKVDISSVRPLLDDAVKQSDCLEGFLTLAISGVIVSFVSSVLKSSFSVKKS